MTDANDVGRNEYDYSDYKEVHIPVTTPDGDKYVLCEPSGEAVVQFNNARAASATLKDGGVVGVKSVGDVEPLLVSLCLFPADSEDPTSTTPIKRIPHKQYKGKWIPNNVTQAFVRSLPGKLQSKLFNKAKEIGEIDLDADLQSLIKERDRLNELIEKLEAEDPAKNEPESTETGSD